MNKNIKFHVVQNFVLTKRTKENTPYIESDHHVDFENIPPEAEEVLSYQRFADCFLLQSEEQSLWDLISSAFGVFFSDEEKQQFNNLYGG